MPGKHLLFSIRLLTQIGLFAVTVHRPLLSRVIAPSLLVVVAIAYASTTLLLTDPIQTILSEPTPLTYPTTDSYQVYTPTPTELEEYRAKLRQLLTQQPLAVGVQKNLVLLEDDQNAIPGQLEKIHRFDPAFSLSSKFIEY